MNVGTSTQSSLAGSSTESSGEHAALMICGYCDALYQRPDIGGHEVAHCVRCGMLIRRGHRLGCESLLALSLAGLVAFAVANAYPIMTLNINGITNMTTLWGALVATWQSGEATIAILVAATALAFPLLQLLLRVYVLASTALSRRPPGWIPAMHILRLTGHWSLVEVFMVGIVIAIAKIGDLATISLGIGAWAFAALTILLAAISSVDTDMLWETAAETPA